MLIKLQNRPTKHVVGVDGSLSNCWSIARSIRKGCALHLHPALELDQSVGQWRLGLPKRLLERDLARIGVRPAHRGSQ